MQAYLRDSRDDLAGSIAWASPAVADHGATGEGRLLGHRDDRVPRAGGRCRCTRQKSRDRRAATSAGAAAAPTTTGRCGRRSASTTCAAGVRRDRTAGPRASPDHGTRSRCSTAWLSRCSMRSAAGVAAAVYAPVGELVPEWLPRAPTAREHEQRVVRPASVRGRRRPRRADPSPGGRTLPPRPSTPIAARQSTDGRRARAPDPPEPVREWRAVPRSAMGAAWLGTVGSEVWDVPAAIVGERVTLDRTIDSVNPGEPDRIVARAAVCGASEADAAVAAAVDVADEWGRTPAPDRVEPCPLPAAAWMRAPRRDRARGRLPGARSGEAVGPGRCGRLRGDRLLRVLRREMGAARRGR